MKAMQLEAVLRAAWNVADARPLINRLSLGEELKTAITEADPHGVYRANAPQAPGIDLEETQDIPLRECPGMPRDPEAI